MAIKKAIRWLHLWLGLISGLLVFFLGITGCILAFQREIEDATQEWRFTEVQAKPLLPPTKLKAIADRQLPGKHVHSVTYQAGRSVQVVYFALDPAYFFTVHLSPYTGEVLKVRDMDQDFFRFIINGHYYLWLPQHGGQLVLTSATLIFVVLMISGIILWWPKNKAATKKRFRVKWNAKWRRVNYDLHNVFGFYMTWVAIFIALTGMVMGFQWFANSVYFIGSGGKSYELFTESYSDTTSNPNVQTRAAAADILWKRFVDEDPTFKGILDVHVPETRAGSVEIAKNPDPSTFWKADYYFYDQHTLDEIKVTHPFGKFAEANNGDKLIRMNYDVHVGAIAGLPGKVIAFFASLIAASLPVTGIVMWLGRKKKKPRAERPVAERLVLGD